MRQYGGAMDVQFLVGAGITQSEGAAPAELRHMIAAPQFYADLR